MDTGAIPVGGTKHKMFKWIKKILNKPEEEVKNIDPKTPCWRCTQIVEGGYQTRHQCQHGYNCVMLGWKCVPCRGQTSVRLGFRECWEHLLCQDKCKLKDKVKEINYEEK